MNMRKLFSLILLFIFLITIQSSFSLFYKNTQEDNICRQFNKIDYLTCNIHCFLESFNDTIGLKLSLNHEIKFFIFSFLVYERILNKNYILISAQSPPQKIIF